jgi:hypothetical protein
LYDGVAIVPKPNREKPPALLILVATLIWASRDMVFSC